MLRREKHSIRNNDCIKKKLDCFRDEFNFIKICMTGLNRIPLRTYALIGILILVIFALILLLMGRTPICKCGYVKFWHGMPLSSENSQHLSDWYSFSHIIHGFGFYGILWLIGYIGRWKMPLGLMLIFALLAETGWEIIENTDWVINYYRANTISLDYFGDSVINSVADVLFMVFGFAIARKFPALATVALAVIMEAVVAYYIRDNLTLNILMFIYPSETILNWQQGL